MARVRSLERKCAGVNLQDQFINNEFFQFRVNAKKSIISISWFILTAAKHVAAYTRNSPIKSVISRNSPQFLPATPGGSARQECDMRAIALATEYVRQKGAKTSKVAHRFIK